MSDKPVAGKLLIREGAAVWSSHPERFAGLAGPLPPGAHATDDLRTAGVAVAFADDAAAIRGILDANDEDLAGPTVLWVVYPKGNRTDVNRDSLWPILAEHGLRPITQVAVDDTWSALRFRPLRPDEPPFTGGR
jgi:hypothetical protein